MIEISAAILVLQGLPARIGEEISPLIAQLRRFERLIEHLDQAAPAIVTPDASSTRVSRRPQARHGLGTGTQAPRLAAPVRVAPARASAPTVARLAGTTAATSSIASHVLAYLAGQRTESTRAEIAAAVKMPITVIAWPLKALVRSGRVIATGHTTTRRYSVVKTVRASRSAAGEPEVVVTWSGTKERNGEAPPLRDMSRNMS